MNKCTQFTDQYLSPRADAQEPAPAHGAITLLHASAVRLPDLQASSRRPGGCLRLHRPALTSTHNFSCVLLGPSSLFGAGKGLEEAESTA